jgi:hypothetical protein
MYDPGEERAEQEKQADRAYAEKYYRRSERMETLSHTLELLFKHRPQAPSLGILSSAQTLTDLIIDYADKKSPI